MQKYIENSVRTITIVLRRDAPELDHKTFLILFSFLSSDKKVRELLSLHKKPSLFWVSYGSIGKLKIFIPFEAMKLSPLGSQATKEGYFFIPSEMLSTLNHLSETVGQYENKQIFPWKLPQANLGEFGLHLILIKRSPD